MQSAEDQEELSHWKEESVLPCPHYTQVVQFQNKENSSILEGHSKCKECEITDNLWLCLSCSNIGCGRQQFDNSGKVTGNNHAINHYNSIGHPLAVKIGTISTDCEVDVHCYACDSDPAYQYGEVCDPLLVDHLAGIGIDISQQKKTVKSRLERELEINQEFDFSAVINKQLIGGFGLREIQG